MAQKAAIDFVKGAIRAQAIAQMPRVKAQTPVKLDWAPIPDSPQEMAFNHPADEVFYGGSAGGGKTFLLIGLSLSSHQESIIFRREYPQLKEIISKARKVVGDRGRYNGMDKLFTLNDGRTLELGAVQYEDSWEKYQGRPHDFIGIDEITHFTQTLYQNLTGWNRSTVEGQRCRIVCTGNPPVTPEGQWVKEYWAPWLKEEHPNPAEPGEMRWFAMVDGEPQEVPTGEPFKHGDETIYPRSRTFIPAKLSDNPYLERTNYRAVLQSLPEPMRSRMLYGDFSLEVDDDIWQIIPTAWIQMAFDRWRGMSKPALQTSIGCDPARGGKDKTVIAPVYGDWVDTLLKYPGKATPDGISVAGLILPIRQDNADVYVDVGGIGASPVDCLQQIGIPAIALNGAEAAKDYRGKPLLDKSGKIGFLNLRAYWHWKLRDMLDPAYNPTLALPPDQELLADLSAPRYKFSSWKVQVESKEEIKKRIGRSPDSGEAVIYGVCPDKKPVIKWGQSVAAYG